MAAADTAASVAASSPPPPPGLRSPSNVSSPLSEVEDKDADPDEMDLDMSDLRSVNLHNGNHDDDDDDDDDEDDDDDDVSEDGAPSDSADSNLSEMDVNDSEAETERLYDTPQKNKSIRDIVDAAALNGQERVLERSPSKLQRQIRADMDAEEAADDDGEPLSDEEDEDDEADNDDAASVASKGGESLVAAATGVDPSPRQLQKSKDGFAQESAALVDESSEDPVSDSRKRKRSLAADVSESMSLPLKKRPSSIFAGDRILGASDDVIEDEEDEDDEDGEDKGQGETTNTHSGEQSDDEDGAASPNKRKDDAAAALEEMATGKMRSKKPRRSSMRHRKGSDEEAGEEQEDGEAAVAEDTADRAGEEEQPEAEADEEAEAQQHRNEEELEKKRAAWEQLTSIEKHFTTFRERLYEERLAALNQEEAMLMSKSPTHPEYVAMKACVDARRDERSRVIDTELQLSMETLKRQTTAHRAQIFSQFFQSVRETREGALEELGRQWYEIQQKRRQYANAVPDHGLRFPAKQSQRIANAVAYNKEVSILSGIAKHAGFPAAPEMTGLTAGEIDADFAAINEARHQSAQHAGPAQPAAFMEYSTLPFNAALGPAGEQFLEQTPWANPNHPAHSTNHHHNHHHHVPKPAAGTSPSAGRPGSRRQSQQQQQPGGRFSSSTNSTIPGNLANGDSPVQQHRPHTHPHPHSHGKVSALDGRPLKGAMDAGVKRESIAQAS